MTNKEKYKDWLWEHLEELLSTEVLAVTETGEPAICEDTECSDCLLYHKNKSCFPLRRMWLNSEEEA